MAAGVYKKINGVWHKRCTGIAHEEPVYLPATEKYFYKGSGEKKFRTKCRLCENWERVGATPGYEFGYIETGKVWAYYNEAVSRIGLMELQRRTGVTRETISNVLRHEAKYVRKSTFRKIMLELISIRRKNEYSISVYARWRNERRLIPREMACSGCGCHLNNYSEGCKVCADRRFGRKRWGSLTEDEKSAHTIERRERRERSNEAA